MSCGGVGGVGGGGAATGVGAASGAGMAAGEKMMGDQDEDPGDEESDDVKGEGTKDKVMQALIDKGEEVMVGVNKFKAEKEENIDILEVDNEKVRHSQIQKLSKLRIIN